MTGLLDKLGSNYIIASFIPSLSFILFASYLFNPVFPPSIKDKFVLSLDSPLVGSALLIFVQTLVLGYTLQGLNIFIIKLTEGYSFLNRFDFMRRRQRRKALKRYYAIFRIENLLNELRKKDESLLQDDVEDPKLSAAIEQLIIYQNRLKAQYRQDYPMPAENILPTRFGNILRSAESYSLEQYNIDSVYMFPRLIHVIHPSYYAKMDESSNGLSFLVNSMVLSILLAFFCLVASIYQYSSFQIASRSYNDQKEAYYAQSQEQLADNNEPQFKDVEILYFIPLSVTTRDQQIYYERFWLYLIIMGVFSALAAFFYNASLPAARQYGNIIRSAYDLFRFDLMIALKLPKPKDPLDERQTWDTWTEIITLGPTRNLLEGIVYQYDWNERDVNPNSSTETPSSS